MGRTLYQRPIAAAILWLLMDFSVTPGFALDRIDSPNVTQGEFDLEYNGSRTFDQTSDKNNIQGHEVTIGYTPTDRWGTEIDGLFDHEPDQNEKLQAMQWLNSFQFFEHNEMWVDSGMTVAYATSTQSHQPSEVEVKLLLEKEWGEFNHIANLGFSQEVGSNATGGPDLLFLWSSRYKYSEQLQPGFEIQSDFGKTDENLSFQQQKHYIGPALYGDITEHVGYEAAYLFGITDAASQSAVRLLLQYHTSF